MIPAYPGLVNRFGGARDTAQRAAQARNNAVVAFVLRSAIPRPPQPPQTDYNCKRTVVRCVSYCFWAHRRHGGAGSQEYLRLGPCRVLCVAIGLLDSGVEIHPISSQPSLPASPSPSSSSRAFSPLLSQLLADIMAKQQAAARGVFMDKSTLLSTALVVALAVIFQ
eukprot:608961-Rhodomonas_salina.1